MAEFEVEVIFHVSDAKDADDAIAQVQQTLDRNIGVNSDPTYEILEGAAAEL